MITPRVIEGALFESLLQSLTKFTTTTQPAQHPPQLSLDEERDLGRCIQVARHLLDESIDGDESARPEDAMLRRAMLAEQVLVTRNVRLIYLVAKRFKQYNVHAEVSWGVSWCSVECLPGLFLTFVARARQVEVI